MSMTVWKFWISKRSNFEFWWFHRKDLAQIYQDFKNVSLFQIEKKCKHKNQFFGEKKMLRFFLLFLSKYFQNSVILYIPMIVS